MSIQQICIQHHSGHIGQGASREWGRAYRDGQEIGPALPSSEPGEQGKATHMLKASTQQRDLEPGETQPRSLESPAGQEGLEGLPGSQAASGLGGEDLRQESWAVEGVIANR